APFGPIRPTISPGPSSRLTPSSAWTPPNRFSTSRTSRSGAITSGPPAHPSGGRPPASEPERAIPSHTPSPLLDAERASQQRIAAPGQEQHHRDQQEPVGDQVGPGHAGGGEVAPRQLGQRREDEGAQDRAQDRAAPADDRPEDDVDRERDAEDRVGLQREEV